MHTVLNSHQRENAIHVTPNSRITNNITAHFL